METITKSLSTIVLFTFLKKKKISTKFFRFFFFFDSLCKGSTYQKISVFTTATVTSRSVKYAMEGRLIGRNGFFIPHLFFSEVSHCAIITSSVGRNEQKSVSRKMKSFEN